MRDSNTRRLRRIHGGAMLKLIVWLMIGFAGYCGFKYISVSSTTSQVERALETALSRVGYGTNTDAVAEVMARKASNSKVSLTPEDVRITMEKSHGKRVITADIEFPITVDFLGGERTFQRHVTATREILVNEQVLAAAEQREAQRMAVYEAPQAEAREYNAQVDEVYAECEEKHGKGNCRVMETGGGGDGENRIGRFF